MTGDAERERLLELSDERDAQLRLRLDAWRDGWRADETREGDRYEAGFADGAMALKDVQHDIYQGIRQERERWAVRGEPRTREAFGRPHPGDYPGRGRQDERELEAG